ncbi:MAG: nuclear transport factor 2 family protein [Actinobacteria bacterium]|nr:nuclear transport factor 2 family protein [Actinomycetota bacterium]
MEVGDRLALGRLVKEYAHHVDRREPEAVAALFCEDGVLAIYEGDPEVVAPDRVRTGRREIAATMAGLTKYEVTTHFLGQQMVDVEGDTATGETYCMAHHISEANGARRDKVMAIRYLDRYRRVGSEWKIEERRLAIDWTDDRELPPRV